MTAELSKKILIIDPCSMTRECISLLLRAKKHKVFSTSTMEHGLELTRLHQPDVVVCEIEMIDGSGCELIARTREMMGAASPSFFVLTSCSEKGRLLEVIELGVVQLMIKHGFTIKMFYSKVTMLLRMKRSTSVIAGVQAAAEGDPQSKTPPAAAPQTLGTTAASCPDNRDERPRFLTKEAKAELFKSIKPVITRSEALARAEHVSELKALSPTASRVIALTSSSEASLDSIAKTIRNDHAIALKIIRVANSSAFSRGEPVTTLYDAVLRIGVDQIRQTVVNLEIMENFSAGAHAYIDHRLFWEHSIAVATCCSMIARETRQLDPNEAFTIGLLHDVGRMILSQAFGDDYIDALRFARENQFPIEQIERRMFLLDHASVMSNVLHKWGVHRDLIDPIVNHHLSVGNIRQTCPKRIESVTIVALADRLVHALGIGCSGNATIYPTEEFFEVLRMPEGFLRTLHEKLREMVLDMRFAMLGEMAVNDFPVPRIPCSNIITRPVYITSDMNIDAIKYWVESLREEEDCEAPNIAVVRLRKQREAVTAETKLRNVEREYGIVALPTIVVSNAGNLSLPPSTVVNRPTRLLAAPFTIEEFERAVGSFDSLGGEIEERQTGSDAA